MQRLNSRPVLTFAAIAAAAAFMLISSEGHAQEEGWSESTGLAYYQPMAQPRGKELRIYEIHGSLAGQIGVAAPGPSRSPISLRVLAGVNLLKFDIPALGGRILHGPFITFPFSIEIGYLQDIAQFGPGAGWQFSGRPSRHWKWIFGIQAALAANGGASGGPGLHFGAVYYFLSGFGLFGEINLETYFGSSNAFTAGISAGLMITYEIFKYKEEKEEH